MSEFGKEIAKIDKIINKELLKKYFQFQSLSDMQEQFHETKNAQENKKLVQVIQSGLIDIEKETISLSKDEKPYEVLDTVAKILDFNNQNQEGQGLKLSTPQKMLYRIPISLAQLKAGNNSEKLKNELIKLLYLLHRSKMLSKTN